jgi:cardiolipin synthase
MSTRLNLERTTTTNAGLTNITTSRWCTHRASSQSSTTPRISSLSRPLTAARYFSLTKWRSSPPSQPSQDKPQPPSKVSPLKKVTSVLATPHENIYTIPNFLTLTRLIAAPFIGYCIVNNHHTLALSLFAYAGISDLLDGWIARKWNLKTVVGTIIDPLADKTLMTVLTVALATQGSLPVWLAVIILGRDVGLAIAAVYYRWISLPPPKTMSRYWDFSLPSAEVRPTTISKWNTALQLGLMGGMMVAPVVPVEMGVGLTIMQ